MNKTYKTVTGLLRHGMKMPKAAKDVAKAINASKRPKCRISSYYQIMYLNSYNWFYENYRTLESARSDLKYYKSKFSDAYIIKVTETEEFIE